MQSNSTFEQRTALKELCKVLKIKIIFIRAMVLQFLTTKTTYKK